jgi:uncharacterized protein (DUF2249 family)
VERQLDVRDLEPPEPLERILDALDHLAEEDWLRARLRREPFPLYGFLQRLGYAWRTERYGEAAFDVVIWPATSRAPHRPAVPSC